MTYRDRYRGFGVKPNTNFIDRRGPRTLGENYNPNIPGDTLTGGAITKAAENLPFTPIPADKSTVTSTYDALPINGVTAWATFSTADIVLPPPS